MYSNTMANTVLLSLSAATTTSSATIYDSDYNIIRNNTGYNSRSSQVRINQNSHNNYVMNNKFYGGTHGVYLYGNVTNTVVTGNEIRRTKEILVTDKAQNVFFAHNAIDSLGYKLNSGDRLVFGTNDVKRRSVVIPVDPAAP